MLQNALWATKADTSSAKLWSATQQACLTSQLTKQGETPTLSVEVCQWSHQQQTSRPWPGSEAWSATKQNFPTQRKSQGARAQRGGEGGGHLPTHTPPPQQTATTTSDPGPHTNHPCFGCCKLPISIHIMGLLTTLCQPHACAHTTKHATNTGGPGPAGKEKTHDANNNTNATSVQFAQARIFTGCQKARDLAASRPSACNT